MKWFQLLRSLIEFFAPVKTEAQAFSTAFKLSSVVDGKPKNRKLQKSIPQYSQKHGLGSGK